MIKEEIKKASGKEKRIFLYVLGVIAFTIAVIFVFFRYEDFARIIGMLSNAVMPFLCGLVVAFILNAFVNLFENVIFAPINRRFAEGKVWNKIRRPITMVLSYLIVFAVIAVICFFIVPEFIRSCELFGETASKTLPVYVANATKFLNDVVVKFNLGIDVNSLQKTLFGNFNWGTIIENATKVTTDILSGIVAATFNVASGVFTLIMSVIYSAYFLAGKEKLIKTGKSVLYAFAPKRVANKTAMFLSVSNNVFSAYVRGQLTECVILGTLCYIGMNIIGLDYALLISVILTITALIPMLGVFIGAAIGVFILLMVHPIDALWFLIFLICLQQFEGNVIYPRVVGSSIGLPGIWTLTAVMVFGSLFGIPGIIIGTPTAAVVYRLLRHKAQVNLSEKGITEDILNGSEVMEKYGDVIHPHQEEDDEPSIFHKQYEKFSDMLKDLWAKMTKSGGGKH